MADIIHYLHPFASEFEEVISRLLHTLGRINIKSLGDIWSSEGDSWRQLDAIFEHLRCLLVWLRRLTKNFIETIKVRKGIHWDYSAIAFDWRWMDSKHSEHTFCITNNRAYSLLVVGATDYFLPNKT